MRRPRSMEISTFTIIKGSLIPETYAAFRSWDFEETDDENFERFKRGNVIGAGSGSWLRDVIKVIHRRFDPAATTEHSSSWPRPVPDGDLEADPALAHDPRRVPPPRLRRRLAMRTIRVRTIRHP